MYILEYQESNKMIINIFNFYEYTTHCGCCPGDTEECALITSLTLDELKTYIPEYVQQLNIPYMPHISSFLVWLSLNKKLGVLCEKIVDFTSNSNIHTLLNGVQLRTQYIKETDFQFLTPEQYKTRKELIKKHEEQEAELKRIQRKEWEKEQRRMQFEKLAKEFQV